MLAPPNCYHRGCVHIAIDQPDGTELTERHVCPAFPDGIPGDILDGPNLHTAIDPRQVGAVVFTRRAGRPRPLRA